MVATIGLTGCAINAAPSARAPVPQSKMKCAPASVVRLTHEVLPPNRTVSGPGVAIDPLVPQNWTRMGPPVWLFVFDVEIVEVADELRGPFADLPGRPAAGRLLERCADLGDPVEAVAGAGPLHVVSQDA